MIEKRDNIHYNFKKVDSFNKPFVMVQSCRELGKSTAFALDKAYSAWKKGYTTCFLRFKVVDITSAYITSLENILKKFIDNKIRLCYNKGDLKEGIVFVYIEKKLFCCIVALSIDINRIKSLVLPNIAWMVLDEYVLNPKFHEKYLSSLWDRFSEVFSTFYRETKGQLKCYFLGNVYSRYNPIHEHFKIPYAKMVPGCLLVGDDYVYQAATMTDELYQLVVKKNPLYIRDSEYKDYALGGLAINDKNIRIGKLKNNFRLYLVVDYGDTTIGIYKNNDYADDDVRFFCGDVNYSNFNRDIFCFDFSDLVDGKVMYNSKDETKFEMLRAAMRKNKVEYKDIGTFYKIVEIYNI